MGKYGNRESMAGYSVTSFQVCEVIPRHVTQPCAWYCWAFPSHLNVWSCQLQPKGSCSLFAAFLQPFCSPFAAFLQPFCSLSAAFFQPFCSLFAASSAAFCCPGSAATWVHHMILKSKLNYWQWNIYLDVHCSLGVLFLSRFNFCKVKVVYCFEAHNLDSDFSSLSTNYYALILCLKKSTRLYL